MARRVVITAIGIVSALGHTWNQIQAGFDNDRNVFRLAPFDPEVAVAPIPEFDLKAVTGRFKESRYLNRGAALGVVAAHRAVHNGLIDPDHLSHAGVFVGCGPNFDISREFPEINPGQLDSPTLSALWILRYLPNTMAAVIAKQFGLHGENLTLNTACSASLQAIGEAFRKIKYGQMDVALAGGGDSRINPGGILAYKKARAIHTGVIAPADASRPFDKDATGFVPGEGAAFLLLESMTHARQRGASILAEIGGFGSSMDGGPLTAPEGSGQWAEQAVRSAIQEAGLSTAEVELISAHGTGTRLNDTMEAALIDRLFLTTRPSVIALKSWLGHLAAACGAMETALAVLGMQHDFIPKIRNLETPQHIEPHFCRHNQKKAYRTVLVENFGFGGQNAALILKKH